MKTLPGIAEQLGQRKLALFLDYDGTLTPIVQRPEDATLDDAVRQLLRRLAGRATVAIVSGRDRQDVQNMVQVDELVYAGSHGYDIHGPGGLDMQHEQAEQSLDDLDAVERTLREQVAEIDGALIERKKFGVAMHYRQVRDDDLPRVECILRKVQQQHPALRTMAGKKVYELQPDVPWNKGYAVLWLLEALRLDPAQTFTLYVGDDVTDEDAFRALQSHGAGIGVRVGHPEENKSSASYFLDDCEQVHQFLLELLELLELLGK